MTVNGQTLGENIADAEVYNDDVIRTAKDPIYAEGALAVLKGNLAPDGCVIKPSACEPRLLKHTGPALVFEDYPSMKKAIDDESRCDRRSRAGAAKRRAAGRPGMPEWGMLPIPKKLLKQGVRDMVRLSDARMSGTSYGTCVLHVSPETYIGGPLALVRTGDRVTLDVNARSIMQVCRQTNWSNAAPHGSRRRSLRAWLWLDVRPPHHPSGPGLRFRFS